MTSRRIQNILRSAYNKVERLLEVDQFYVALYDPERAELEFPLVVDRGNPVETGRPPWQPRSYQGNVLPDPVIEQKKQLIFEHDLRKRLAEENVAYWPNEVPPLSWLGVPMIVEDRVIGVIVVENRHKPRAFGDRGVRVLPNIAHQTAMAIANARLYEQLNRKISNLRALNEIGGRLTAEIRLSEQEILELIDEQASSLMDTSNMYIALYDAEQQRLSFPVATQGGKQANYPSRRLELEDRSKGGLIEEVIREKRALRIPNVDNYCQERNIKRFDPPTAKSWLGVPMMIQTNMLGVIALWNNDFENTYAEDEVEVLQTMADQAAVAIANARLYHEADRRRELEVANQQLEEQKKKLQQANRKIADTEATLVRDMMAEDIVHSLNNLVGPIPVWVDLIEEEIAKRRPQKQQISDRLAVIKRISYKVFDMVEVLKKPPLKENIKIANMLKSIVRQIEIQNHEQINQWEIEIDPEIQPGLHRVLAVPSLLGNAALLNVVSNGLEAILSQGEGKLTIKASNLDRFGSKWIKIEVRDTGQGIPKENLDKIFTPFFTTKEKGTGYGLWRAKTVVESLGGEIRVDSKLKSGTTFTILLPGADQEE